MHNFLFCFVLFFSLCTLSHTHTPKRDADEFFGKMSSTHILCSLYLWNRSIFCVWFPSSNWQCACIGFVPLLLLHYLFSLILFFTACINMNIDQFGDTFFVFFSSNTTVAFINLRVPYACMLRMFVCFLVRSWRRSGGNYGILWTVNFILINKYWFGSNEGESRKRRSEKKTEVKQNNSDKFQNEAIYTILIP